jgi:hypothetical protein
LPPPIIRTKDGLISWRKYALETNEPYIFDSSAEGLSIHFHCDIPISTSTFIVAIVGDRTLWGDDFRNKIKIGIYEKKEFPPEELDKILLIEIPNNNIAWDSLKDYSVEEALNLWPSQNFSRGFFQKPGLCYITLHGKYGRISDFTSKEAFRKMIEFNDEEIRYLCPQSTLLPENTRSNVPTD